VRGLVLFVYVHASSAADLGSNLERMFGGEAGTPFPRLSLIMGSSPATTAKMAKRYGHVSTDALREDLAVLDRLSIEAEWAQ
jgi:hypothetical protein